jgi:HK97 family phage portal protein
MFKFLQSAYGGATRVIGGLWTRYNGQGWTRWRSFLPSARFDWEREAADTWMNSIVALSVSWLGDRFPRPRIQLSKIGRNGDYTPLGRHPLLELWNRPNKYYNRRTLEKAIGLGLKVDGNAYIWKVRNRTRGVVELWNIPFFRCFPTWPSDGSEFIDGYMVWVDTVRYWLPKDDVIHIRDGQDPRNERYGLSALRACLREVVTLNYEASYTAGILKNSGVPSVVIAPEVTAAAAGHLRPSPDDVKRIKDRFHENFGIDNDQAGSAMVLAGPYKVTSVGFSPEQMTLKDLPMNAMGRISASIGVAAMSVGLPDPGKTYSNLGEANRSSWGTIVSIQEVIGDALRWDLLPEFNLDPHSYAVTYDYSEIQELQEPLDAIHVRAREDWKAGITNLNETREILGYEPDPDGDRFFPGTGSEADEPAEPDAIPGVDVGIPKRLSLTNGNGRH